MIQLEVKHFKN